MILTPNYCWERVQKHRITLGIQYHGLRVRIRAYVEGNRKKYVKKAQNNQVFALFWGGLLTLVHGYPQKKSKNAIFQKLRYFNHNPTRRKDATY